ncbi:MAG: hypothetical protein DMG35_19600 [Acidobacteria bacterium]|nr:MAG: hypothetical protein DMG35_19600 [Acidobacteriota bacterium]
MAEPTVTADAQAGAPGPQPSWVNRLVGMPGVASAFLWGLAEGTFFFVVPDVAISLVAMLEPRRAWRHILAAIAGSVIAGMLLFAWSSRDPRSAREAVAHVPFVTARMFAQVDASYRMHRLGAVFLGPLSGIPYKIYAVEAPEFLGSAAFLSCTVPARAERFLTVWVGFGLAGTFLRRSRGWTASQLAVLYGSFWVLFYAFYWSRIAFR